MSFDEKFLLKSSAEILSKRENKDSVVGRIMKLTERNHTEKKKQQRQSREKTSNSSPAVIKAEKWIKIPERAQQLQKIHHHLGKKKPLALLSADVKMLAFKLEKKSSTTSTLDIPTAAEFSTGLLHIPRV